MANTTKQTRELKAVLSYADSDTRTISVPNARTWKATDASTVRTRLNSFGAITIGDKTGAEFSSVKTAYIEDKTTVTLDLSTIFNQNS